jgi:hypothetical protein
VPFASPAALTDTVIVEGAVPDVGLMFNQLALSLAVQLSVPVPQLEMLNDCGGGLAPLDELKVRLVGLVHTLAPFTFRITETLSWAQQVAVRNRRFAE